MDEALDKTPGGPEEELPNWSRRQFLLGTTGLAVAGAAALWTRTPIVDAARAIFGSPVDTGLVHVYQEDFYFVPNYMTWRVGDKMTMRLQNMSLTRYHEMQIGRHVSREQTIFGTLTADGFTEDFWDGVPVTFSNPYKMDNLVYSKAIPTFIGPKSDYLIEYGGALSPTLKPGGHIDLTFVVPDKPGIWQYG
ncbi:MAG: hypothetical protein M1499_04525 [Firmicutes bacterium]|nr:hypothetical protein [Bacillota bacterium]